MTKVIKVGQENMTGKRDSKKEHLKLLLTRAKNRHGLILVLSIKHVLFKGYNTFIVLFVFFTFVLIGYMTNYIEYIDYTK